MRLFVNALITLLAAYVVACVGLFLVHRSMIYFPQPRLMGSPASVMEVELNGHRVELSARPLNVPDAIIYFGGNGEDVSVNLAAMTQAFPNKAIYLMHYRGYGGSEGKPTEAALVADALALFDMLKVPHPNLTLIGRSLGSGVAVQVASVRPASRLVLVTPFNSIAELGQQRYPLFPVKLLMADKYDSWRYAPLVTAPTVLVIAEKDEMIPRASSELLYRHFQPGVARQIVIDSASHNTISEQDAYMAALAGSY